MGRRPATSRVGTRLLAGLVIGVLVVLSALAATRFPDLELSRSAAQVVDLAVYPMLLGASALLYAHLRLSGSAATAWLVAAAAFGTAQGTVYSALRVAMEPQARADNGWLAVSEVAVAAMLTAMLAASGRIRLAVNPVLLGLSLAALVTIGRLLLLAWSGPWPSVPGLRAVLLAVVLLLYGASAWLLLRRVRLPAWAGERLALVMVVLGIAHVLTYPVPPADWRSFVAVVLDLWGAVLLGVTSLRLVRTALDHQHAVDLQVRQLEALLREDRTLLHEVATTVAGINAASTLVATTSLAPADQRRMVELMARESARLGRMVSPRNGSRPVDLALDDVLTPVVLAHRVRGLDVAWRPGGHGVHARADDVAEVLDVLLDNAAVHSGSPTVDVESVVVGDEVQVSVTDSGRGIPLHERTSAVEWGRRGPDSPGHGIGLHAAYQLVVGMGGRLVIDGSRRVGTRIVVTLPGARGDLG